MPIHDWTRVDVGIFHAMHHAWITEISRALNRTLLPSDFYALPEDESAQFDLTSGNDVALTSPKLQPIAETEMGFYRRKQKTVTVRHVSGDRIVAIVEIVSPANKASRDAIRALVVKAAQLLEQQIHLLVIDLHPPGRCDPEGIHGEIWHDIAGAEYTLPPDKPLTLVAYEAALGVQAYVDHVAVGDAVNEMPLFLEPDQAITIPLEATYNSAYVDLPRRWKRVLEASSA